MYIPARPAAGSIQTDVCSIAVVQPSTDSAEAVQIDVVLRVAPEADQSISATIDRLRRRFAAVAAKAALTRNGRRSGIDLTTVEARDRIDRRTALTKSTVCI